MKIRTYSSEGIILARKNYSEADRILTCFSKSYGKISLLAKGIRKLKSKKRGHLEVFSHIKFSASRGHGMDIIRTNLNKISLAYYFCEVITKITREDEIHNNVFNLLTVFLCRLENETKLKKLRHEFLYELLKELGYWPENKKLIDADMVLEEVVERQINSFRVGKKILQ
ncbi:MAG: repair protein RecO protein [Candidatus Woesebacteria bacterium GW2011_GWE2_31_6]|nr:MAG: repair protein RecO protein [Candidatus Woesebacteria bacterium GW2011_GWE2_31_6]